MTGGGGNHRLHLGLDGRSEAAEILDGVCFAIDGSSISEDAVMVKAMNSRGSELDFGNKGEGLAPGLTVDHNQKPLVIVLGVDVVQDRCIGHRDHLDSVLVFGEQDTTTAVPMERLQLCRQCPVKQGGCATPSLKARADDGRQALTVPLD